MTPQQLHTSPDQEWCHLSSLRKALKSHWHFTLQLCKQALVGALLRSFMALKKRLQKPADGTPLEQPLLEACVMLSMPTITVNPGLEEIQNTINSVTHSVIDLLLIHQSRFQLFRVRVSGCRQAVSHLAAAKRCSCPAMSKIDVPLQ